MPGPFSWAVQTPTQTVVKVSVPLHYFSYLKGRERNTPKYWLEDLQKNLENKHKLLL